jgi:hypothetical protein
MRKYLAIFAVGVLAALAVRFAEPTAALAACTLKSWNPGDTVKAGDLNTNFSCLNGTIFHGPPASILTADIATGQITRPLLATPAMLPVAWWSTATICSVNGACAITQGSSSGITSVTRTGTGTYAVVLQTNRPDTTYSVMPFTIATTTAAGGEAACGFSVAPSLSGWTFLCNDSVGPTSKDVAFGFIVMDDD